MRSDHYVWLIWASSFLIPWVVLFTAFPGQRREMWWASVFTMPFGLTEPLFVPKYWNPPSLFDLAQRTGFDIESLIFCFAIGGTAAVLYNALTGRGLQPVGRPLGVRLCISERNISGATLIHSEAAAPHPERVIANCGKAKLGWCDIYSAPIATTGKPLFGCRATG
jgi:hypothetical protein